MAYENLPTLPDPTTNPAGPGFTSISYSDNSPGLTHYLNNGGAISVRFAGSYWTFQISYHELTLAEAANFFPFLFSISGGFKDFYLQNPLFVNPRTGAWSGNMANGAITLISEDTVQIPAWSTRGGDLSAGDMLKFTNSNKIYQIIETSLVSNVKTLKLNCPVVEPAKIPTAGLEPNNIKFRVRATEGFQFTPQFTSRGLYESFTIPLRENIL